MSIPVRVCALADVPPESGREFVIQDRVIAVFRTADGVFAMDGICPHAGGPLAQGMLRGCVVTCPWHGWQFQVDTGCHKINARIHVATFPVIIENEEIFVELP